MVDLKTHLSLFNILISKGGVKDGYRNTLVTNLPITMFYNLQNATFMHISSTIHAIEDVYVTLVGSKFIMEKLYFFQICISFCFFVGS